MKLITSLLTAPVFEGDEERTQNARLLHVILWTFLMSVTVILAMGILALPENTPRWLLLIGVVDTLCLFSLGLNRRGYMRIASVSLILSLWAIITATAWTADGIHAPAVTFYVIVVLIAGLLLGGRASLVIAVVCSTTALGMVYAEMAGTLPPSIVHHTPLSLWVANIFLLVIVIGLQYLATKSIKESLQRARQELRERQKAEQSLSASEAQYRTLFEESPTGIAILDADDAGYRISAINPAGCLILGYPHEDLIGMNVSRFIDPDDLARQPVPPLEEMQSGKTIRRERIMARKDGTRISLLGSFKQLPDGHFLYIYQDITERKRAEEALRESEERYRLISTVSSDYMFSTQVSPDGELHHNWMVGAFESITGYTFEEYVGRGGWRATVHPDDAEENNRDMDSLQANKPLITEIRTIHKSGEVRWARVYAHPTWDAQNNRLSGVYGAVQDVTERKQAEEALRESQGRLQLFFNQSLSGFFFSMLDEPMEWNDSSDKEKVLDYVLTHQHITEVNDAMLKQYGATRENFLGRTASDFFAHDPEQGRQYQRKLFDAGRLHTETEERKDDGTPIWIEGDYVCMYDDQGRITGMFGIQRDISERKQGEAALDRERDQLQALVDNIPDTIYFKDTASHFTRINRAQLKVLGVDNPQDVIGKTDFDFQPKDLAESFYAEEQKIVESGQPVINRIEYNPTAEGKPRWFSATKVPLKNKEGQVTGIVGVSRNITEQMQIEEALREAEEDLKQLVQERTAALSQANTLLQTMLDYTPDHIFFKDLQGRFIRNSKSQSDMLGLSEPAQVIGKTDFDFFPHAQRSNYEEQSIIKSGQPMVDFEEHVFWPDGRETWFSTTKVPLRDQEGKIIGTFGIARDITDRKRAEEALRQAKDELEIRVAQRTAKLKQTNEQLRLELTARKQAEEALRESGERLQLFFNQSLAGFFFSMIDKPIEWNDSIDKEKALDYILDHQRITEANDAMVEQYGATREAFLGRSVREFFAHDLLEGRQFRKKLFDQGHLHISTDERKDDDTPMLIGGDYVCLYDKRGRITGMFGIQRDITERKRAEQEIRENEQRYRALFEQSNDAIFIMSLDRRILAINQHAVKLFGYSEEEMIGKDTLNSLHMPQTEIDDAHRKFEQIVAGEKLPIYERAFIRKDGSTLMTEINLSLIHDMAGKPWLVQSIIRDITERKQAEINLRQRESILEVVADAANLFLKLSDWRAEINTVLEKIGKTINASHAYLFENHQLENDDPVASMRFEWTAPSFESDLGNPKYIDSPLAENDFETWYQNMIMGLPYIGDQKHLNQEDMDYLLERGMKALLDVPIYVDGRWWGTIGFDDMAMAREWSNSEVDALLVAGNILGAAIQRQQAEEALRQNEQRLRMVLDNLGEGVAVQDSNWHYTYANPAAHAIVGWPSGTLVGATEDAILSPASQTLGKQHNTLRGKGEISSYETQLVRPNGEVRTIIATGVPRLDEQNRLVETFVAFTDITERKQAEEELQRARQRLVTAVEEERRRLRRDLHDGLGPNLASQGLKLAAVRQLLENDLASAAPLLDQVMAQNKSTVKEVRRLVYGLRPPALDELGLVAAIRDHIAGIDGKSTLQIDVTEPPEGLPPLSAAVEVAAYRIVLEALTNVMRHAQAKHCTTRFSFSQNGSNGNLQIEVVDNGIGLPHDLHAGVGLRSMRERAEELGGTCVIESDPGPGTRVCVRLPLNVA